MVAILNVTKSHFCSFPPYFCPWKVFLSKCFTVRLMPCESITYYQHCHILCFVTSGEIVSCYVITIWINCSQGRRFFTHKKCFMPLPSSCMPSLHDSRYPNQRVVSVFIIRSCDKFPNPTPFVAMPGYHVVTVFVPFWTFSECNLLGTFPNCCY